MTRAPGEMRGPVIVVENDKVVLGYNREKLEEFVPLDRVPTESL